MRLPPMPARFMATEVELARQDGSAPYDGEFGEPYARCRCRVEESRAVLSQSYQLAPGARARVYVDARDVPGGVLAGDSATWGGERRRVVSAERFDHPDGAPHHWEVDCA